MSDDAKAAVRAATNADEDLRAQVVAATSLDEVVAILAGAGVTVTVAELQDAATPAGELSDTELDAVSGAGTLCGLISFALQS